MGKDENTTPTWGYHESEPPKIFDLKDGEKLPAGWKDSPAAFEKADDEQKRRGRPPAAKADDER